MKTEITMKQANEYLVAKANDYGFELVSETDNALPWHKSNDSYVYIWLDDEVDADWSKFDEGEVKFSHVVSARCSIRRMGEKMTPAEMKEVVNEMNRAISLCETINRNFNRVVVVVTCRKDA